MARIKNNDNYPLSDELPAGTDFLLRSVARCQSGQ
jgi:hypothetical protein